MARPLRIQFPNAHYHVTCRGNGREAIVRSDRDRTAFLQLLDRSSQVYLVDILGFVLMRNHFHLLVRTPRGNLQEFMRHFNISYTSYFNRTHHRSGHLYQGRYKAFLIDADSYLLDVSRYVHLNPVRLRAEAGRTAKERKISLGRYPWSSYPGYLSPKHRCTWVNYEILESFGGDTPKGRAAYRRFVEQGLTRKLDDPLEKGRGHSIIGDASFLEKVTRFLKSGTSAREVPAIRRMAGARGPERIISLVSAETGVAPELLLSRGSRGPERTVLMELLYRHGGMNQREIGERMGIDYSAVSIRRKRFQAALEKDPKLRELFASLEARISQE
jgi:REP element-mobilizing transposase RayT